MPKEGYTSITIKDSLLAELKQLWKAESSSIEEYKESTFIQQLLAEYIDYHKKLREYGPFMEYLRAKDNKIFLIDSRKGKEHTVVVSIRSDTNQLWCEDDEKSDCVHVGFCFGVKEVYNVLIEKGFPMPKEIH